MSITTMEGLQAVPVDHEVDIDGNTWLRTEVGLKRLEVDLPLRFFEGRLAAGQVQDARRRPPTTGDWYTGSTRIYLLSEVTDTRVHYLSWQRGRLSNTHGTSAISTWTDSSSMRRLEGPPQEFVDSGMDTIAVVLAEQQREVRRLTALVQQNDTRLRDVEQMRRDARDALAYMNRLSEYLNRG